MKNNLKFGDVSMIAKEIGCSTTTVQLALDGKIDTLTAKIVRDYAEIVIRQRDERIKQLEETIKPMYHVRRNNK